MHNPWVTTDTSFKEFEQMRVAMEPIMYQFGVDIMYNGACAAPARDSVCAPRCEPECVDHPVPRINKKKIRLLHVVMLGGRSMWSPQALLRRRMAAASAVD